MSSSQVDVAGDRLEVLEHFSEEGSNALDALIEAFGRQHGDVTVDNTGVHISKLRLHVKSRILQEDPPDVWVEWPGKNLRPSVEAGVVADVTDLWERTGMVDAYVDEAVDSARFDGQFHCLPLDIYRINNVYYNAEMVERAGVDPAQPTTPAGFLDMLAALDDALEVPPLLFFSRDPFGPCQLWESLVVAHGGARTYEAIASGDAAAHRDVIREAMETLDAVLAFAPDGVEFVTSEAADGYFSQERAAVHVNGMWAIGRMAGMDGFDYGTDWGHVPIPGTESTFILNMNSLVPSARAAGSEAVRQFLTFAGSTDGIEVFNGEVGGIPPRTDASADSLHPLVQEQKRVLDDVQDQVPSMTHGLGVTPEELIGLKDAFATYMTQRDVDAAVDAIVETL